MSTIEKGIQSKYLNHRKEIWKDTEKFGGKSRKIGRSKDLFFNITANDEDFGKSKWEGCFLPFIGFGKFKSRARI
jgi:hypothetical protein